MNAFLFFDGTKIIIALIEKGRVKACVERDFGGILHREFVNPDELGYLFEGMLLELLGKNKYKTSVLVISVPPEFVHSGTGVARLNFPKAKRVTEKDKNDLLDQVSFDYQDRVVIDKDIIYYKVNGESSTYNVLGESASLLEALVKVASVERRFIATVTDALPRGLFKSIRFICGTLAIARYLIDETTRDQTCLLVSSGMFATSISVITGEHIIAQESLNMGLAHVINDVCIVKNVDHLVAESLVKKATLCVKHSDRAQYTLVSGDKYSAREINEIIASRIEEVAEELRGLIQDLDRGLLSRPVFVCGGYLDLITGGRQVLQDGLRIALEQLVCPLSNSQAMREVLLNALAHTTSKGYN